jgi:hypothetical protein
MPPPSDPAQLPAYLRQETARMAQAAQAGVDALDLDELAAEPVKYDTGKVVFADGTIWNPGAGRGVYVYDGGWLKVGPPLTGTAVLVGGTVVVSLASITADSQIFLTCQVPGGTPGFLRISARSAGVSFTILSSSGTDTSTVAYMVVEP